MNIGYTLPARLYPLALACLPVGLAVIAWFPDQFAGQGLLGGLLTTAGFSYFLSQLGRDSGRKKQEDLWTMWGGKPSTQLLRHRDKQLDTNTKSRYHSKLARIVPDITMPTAQQEATDPVAADAVYDSCVKFLIHQTRDNKKYSLLFKENVSYGFRRNLWGMKSAGITLAAIGLAAAAASVAVSLLGEFRMVAAVAALLNASLLTWWLLRINPDWVRVPAFAYAHELLAATENLSDSNPQAKPRIVLP